MDYINSELNNTEFPSYSVLMAVYIKDNPMWFELALDSVINQTLAPNEIVIVEDGEITDELKKVIERKSLSSPDLIHTVPLPENVGLGEALKIGITKCENELIFRMDSDDYSVPDRCKRQLIAMEKERCDMVGCDVCEFVGSTDNVVAMRVFPEKHDDLYKFAKRRAPFAHPAVLLKKSHVLNVGNYRHAYLHEDFDLFYRLFAAGYKGYTIKEPLVYMRVSNDFYARRGGISYLKALLGFNMKMYKSGWTSLWDLITRSFANIISCLMPNKLRDRFYKKVLRK